MSLTSKNAKNCEYIENGVMISPNIPTVGEKIKISYDGLLAKSGATQVYAHVGYGSKWDGVCDYHMKKTKTGFEALIPVESSSTLNLCFKDAAGNWDNNSGKNYVFNVSH